MAAFFDVDGTLVKSTIVHYYIYFRRRCMSPAMGRLWQSLYLAKCAGYLVMDRFDRNRLNILFYRDYRRLDEARITAMAEDCYRDVMVPRQFPSGLSAVASHRQSGHDLVLVTGSIGFIMAPLARALAVDHVISPRLLVKDGRFTGALDGPPLAGEEKAKRMRQYADQAGIDLSRSYAYADSIADLPMLRSVGFPTAVNPDRKLAAEAQRRNWPIEAWNTDGSVQSSTAMIAEAVSDPAERRRA